MVDDEDGGRWGGRGRGKREKPRPREVARVSLKGGNKGRKKGDMEKKVLNQREKGKKQALVGPGSRDGSVGACGQTKKGGVGSRKFGLTIS